MYPGHSFCALQGILLLMSPFGMRRVVFAASSNPDLETSDPANETLAVDVELPLASNLESPRNLLEDSSILDITFNRGMGEEIVYVVDSAAVLTGVVGAMIKAALGRQQIAVLQRKDADNADGVTNCSCKNSFNASKLLLDYRSPNETVPLTVFMFSNHTSFIMNNLDAFMSPRNTWIFGSRSLMPDLNATLSTNLYFYEYNQAVQGPDRENLALYEIFGMKNGTRSYVREISPASLRARVQDWPTMGQRRNFHGLVIDVGHVSKPEIFTRTGAETINDGQRRWGADLISYQMLGYMQDYLNFSIQFHNGTTWVYALGTPPDGTLYGGQALMVREGKADLALSNTQIWATKDFGFLYITRLYKEVFIYYHTTMQSAAGDLFIELFPFNVVMCLTALVGVVILAAVLFFNDGSYEEVLSWAAAIFSQQGPQEPKYRHQHQRSGRLFLLTLLIFCILFYSSVSALLLAKLSFSEGISDVNALIKRGYKFGIWSDSALDNGFKLKQLKPSSPIYPVGKYYKPYATEAEGAAEVAKTKKFGFVSYQNWFLSYRDALSQLDICKNMKQLIIPDEKRWGSAFVNPKSEFRDHFNLARLQMAQVGLKAYHLRELDRTTQEGKPSCYLSSSTDTQVKNQATLGGISFEEVSLALSSLGVGFAFCLAILVIEFVHSRTVMSVAVPAVAINGQSIMF